MLNSLRDWDLSSSLWRTPAETVQRSPRRRSTLANSAVDSTSASMNQVKLRAHSGVTGAVGAQPRTAVTSNSLANSLVRSANGVSSVNRYTPNSIVRASVEPSRWSSWEVISFGKESRDQASRNGTPASAERNGFVSLATRLVKSESWV